MPVLDYVTQRELLDLLAPLLGNEEERRGLLQLALGAEHPLLRRLDCTGAAEIFILKTVDELTALGEIKPGQPALWAWLEEIKARLRSPDQLKRLAALQPLLNPTAGQTSLLSPLKLRVFLASPGDVADERDLALKVLDQLSKHGEWRGRVKVEPVAWDEPGVGVPMLVNMNPQEAILRKLPKPSECDIVIVIFWSRMGTPLQQNPDWVKPEDDSPYLSGTEWEYLDALRVAQQTGKPEILVYRRTEVPAVPFDDPHWDEKRKQWDLVQAFFRSFLNPDGSIRHSHHLGC